MNYGCFSRGVKIVLTVHDLSFIISPEFFSLKDRLWHRWINSSKLFSRVDHFIAVSECTKRDLMALFSIPESRISVCPLGVDPIFFSGNPLISRGSLHVPEAYIFAHSVDQRRKNASQLVEAFARLRRKEKYKNISLFLLGHEARMPRWLSHAIACTGVYDSVLYRSRASQEELRALYSYAEVFVYPSMYEGFGLPPLEAAACGTPVIASSVTSTREISGEFALLTHPYDVGSLACALEELLTNQDVRTRCVERGLRVARRYTWDRSVQKHSEVFTYVTNRN